MCGKHTKMHTMMKNISMKDAHPSEPLHERSNGCAFRIKIGLLFNCVPEKSECGRVSTAEQNIADDKFQFHCSLKDSRRNSGNTTELEEIQ